MYFVYETLRDAVTALAILVDGIPDSLLQTSIVYFQYGCGKHVLLL